MLCPSIPLEALTFTTAFKDGEKVVNVEGVDKSSSWASIARIDVQCADGSSNAYFLKVSSNPPGITDITKASTDLMTFI